NHDDEGVLELYAGGVKVAERKPCKVKKGPNTFRIVQSIGRDRLAVYRARIRGFRKDTLLDNNSDVGLVDAAGKPRVLIVDRDRRQTMPLRDALVEQGIRADVRPARAVPETLADLQNYDLLILSGVPATDLKQRQMEIVRTYVKDLG